MDDEVHERWLRHEAQKMMEGLVGFPRPLLELVGEPEPTARTRGGDAHRFDRAALHALHDALSPLGRASLALPITFYVERDLPADCYVSDAGAIRALRELGVARAEPRAGRVWMGLVLAQTFQQRFPTLAQFLRM